jgi:MFS family permease
MLVAMVVSISVASTIDVLAAYLPIYGTETGLSVPFVGLLLSIRAGFTILSRVGMDALINRFGWQRTLVVCLAISAAMLVLLPTTAVPVILIAVMALLGLAIGLTQPMTITWVANQAPRAERSTALAVRLTGNRISLLFVPAVMGAVAGGAGVAAVFWILAAALGFGAFATRTTHLDTGAGQRARTAPPPADGATPTPGVAGAGSVASGSAPEPATQPAGAQAGPGAALAGGQGAALAGGAESGDPTARP